MKCSYVKLMFFFLITACIGSLKAMALDASEFPKHEASPEKLQGLLEKLSIDDLAILSTILFQEEETGGRKFLNIKTALVRELKKRKIFEIFKEMFPKPPVTTKSASSSSALPVTMASAPEPFICSKELITDWTGKVQQQEGATCGYHAVWNLAQIMAFLQTRNMENANDRLRQGPPLQEWQQIIDREYNIDDAEVAYLAKEVMGLPPQDITIISNISEWSPALNENFWKIAEELQNPNNNGKVHGFLVNTARHIPLMNETFTTYIENLLKKNQRQDLLTSFNETIKEHKTMSRQTEEAILQIILDDPNRNTSTPEGLIGAFLGINQGSHATSVGHWLAIAAQNVDGVINLHIANSMYDPKTQLFGYPTVVNIIYEWITTDPKILEALSRLPHILETAQNVLEVNTDVKQARWYMKKAMSIIANTTGIENNTYYKEKIRPFIDNNRKLIGQLEQFGE